MAIFKVAYLWILAVIFTTFFGLTIVFLGLFRLLNLIPSNRSVQHKLASLWAKTIVGCMPGWKVSITGKENIPSKESGYVIVSNHESMTDILMVYLLGIHFKWLSKIENFNIPLVGRAMRECGYIAINRGDKNSHHSAMEQSSRWIKEGVPMLFFPEGTRTKVPGVISEFKIGAFKLAADLNVPLLPIVLCGAGRLMRKGSITPHDAEVKITVLPPVFPKDYEDIDTLRLKIYSMIVAERARLDTK